MKATNLPRRTALVALAALFCVPAGAGDKTVVKEFHGGFHSGFYAEIGGVLHMFAVFIDHTRPAVIKAADDKISEGLLKAVCKNGDSLKSKPATARKLDAMQGSSRAEAMHIAVFTLPSITKTTEYKGAVSFEPGPLTTLREVVKKFGEPAEKEAWVAKEFVAWIGLNGTVYWWGAVGVGCSADGSITHVLIREREGWN